MQRSELGTTIVDTELEHLRRWSEIPSPRELICLPLMMAAQTDMVNTHVIEDHRDELLTSQTEKRKEHGKFPSDSWQGRLQIWNAIVLSS